ncbi:MAG: septal ring lytic transglycosylase RlpA family protein [Sphingomicrobium sp.]
MATVPPAALFGFSAMQHPAPADSVVVTLPMSNAAKPLLAAVGDSLARIPEASPAALEASYYGNEFAGRPTANGETFNPELRTAAHRTLPFGTLVRVTDALTGKATLVKINDRGPFHGNREIDLSTAAARDIGMIARGTARVILEVVRHA